MEFFSSNEATIHYADLTPSRFNEIMQQYGCLLIRGLFQAEEIAHLKQETLDLFLVIKNLLHNNLINEANKKYIGGGHPADILPSLASLESVLNKDKLIECLKVYFKKDEFVVNVESTGIRRCDPHQWKNYLPWHQDLFHRQDTFITCWMPFMSIDEKTPGLDLVPKKLTTKVGGQDGMDVAYNNKGLTDEMIDATVSKLRWRPMMEAGDVLIFDPYCPHRTSYDENYTTERYSIDIRIHPKDCLPDTTWQKNVISLPSNKPKNAYPKKQDLFELRHLVDLSLPPPAAANASASKDGRIKRFFAKMRKWANTG